MNPSRRLRPKSLLIALTLVLAALSPTVASAKPAPFVPSPGSYSGTVTTMGQNFDLKSGVYVRKGTVSFGISVRALMSCANGSTETLDQGFLVKPKGKAFAVKVSGASGITGYYHYELVGSFTSKTSFSGTFRVKGNSNSAGSCSGESKFSLKKG